MVEYILKLLEVLNFALEAIVRLGVPKIFTGVPQTLLLDLGDFILVLNRFPGEIDVQKIKNHEVKAPKIISAREVLF